jgi:hypothetical protein
MAPQQRRLIDYTQRGKPLNREFNSQSDRSCCSASCSSEPVTSASWQQQREPLSTTNSSDTVKSTHDFIVKANESSGLDEKIDFMLKIPSDRTRRRSDLRERFTKSRSFKRSNLIETTLSEASSRRRTRRFRASF